MITQQVILELAKEHDSFYLYDESEIIAATAQLKKDFKDVTFLYSLKANSHPLVLKAVFSQGFGADAASAGEVALSDRWGLPREEIFYSAPGKSHKDIAQTIDRSTLIADSLTEILCIQEIAQEKDIVAKIGVRINPDFNFFSDKGSPSKFGIDETLLFEQATHLKALKHIEIVGIHVHSRSQELRADILRHYYGNVFSLAKRVQDRLGISLQFINLGSGLGVPYSRQDKPLDTKSLGQAATELIHINQKVLPNAAIFIETGRFVVTQCGIYVSKVIDRKTSYGKTFIVLSNTLNGFMRPALAQWIGSYAGDESPQSSEPLFTSINAYEVITLASEKIMEKVTLVGNLCTATDVIARDILLPKLIPGDVVVIPNAGSYAAVLSPLQFSSQPIPKELFLTIDGKVIDLA